MLTIVHHNVGPYSLLGVPPGASEPEVRAAWLAKVRLYHPDRWAEPGANHSAHVVTAALNTARDLLSDPKRRRQYDTLNKVAATKCVACAGAGTVLKQKGFGKKVSVTCVACDGTGNTP